MHPPLHRKPAGCNQLEKKGGGGLSGGCWRQREKLFWAGTTEGPRALGPGPDPAGPGCNFLLSVLTEARLRLFQPLLAPAVTRWLSPCSARNLGVPGSPWGVSLLDPLGGGVTAWAAGAAGTEGGSQQLGKPRASPQ